MKKLIILFFVFTAGAFLVSCERDPDLETGEAVPAQLDIIVKNGAGAVVAGATVDLYNTLNGYVQETGAAATKTTDANGKVSFTLAELGEPGAKYFNVASGELRNWSSVSATPIMTLTAGITTINTVVAPVLPQFLALSGNRFQLTSYTYPGDGNILTDPANACYADDEMVFLKTGRMFAYDDGVACGTHFKGYTAAGVDYSAWSLNATGTTITIRDLDPFFNTANPVAGNALTISGDGNTVTIDFGGGYVATLTKL